MAKIQITITDKIAEDGTTPGLEVEIHTNDAGNTSSTANLMAAWIGMHWTELLALFIAQLSAAEQERTGAQQVAVAPAPQILGSDGRPAHAEDLFQAGRVIADQFPEAPAGLSLVKPDVVGVVNEANKA